MKETEGDHIHFRRIRPRIRVETPYSVDEIHDRIKCRLKDEAHLCHGQLTQGFATIFPPPEEQHFWSPQLTLTMEELPQGSLVRGLYGPQPSVWTMFVFFYSFIGFVTMIVAMTGLSFWSLGKPSAILWWVPVLLLLFLSLYLTAYFGQRLGHKQMTRLHRFIERCLDQKIEAY